MIGGGFYQVPSSSPNTEFPLSPQLQSGKTTIFPYLGFRRQLIFGFYLLLLGSILISFSQASDKDEPSPMPSEGVESGKQDDGLGQVLNGAKPGRDTKGHTKQWEKPGSMEDANGDFDSLNPQNVKNILGGRTGELPDGRKVNVRDHSSDGRPTLEVQDGKNRIKVRYGEGE